MICPNRCSLWDWLIWSFPTLEEAEYYVSEDTWIP